jgi:hypothetical protein
MPPVKGNIANRKKDPLRWFFLSESHRMNYFFIGNSSSSIIIASGGWHMCAGHGYGIGESF